jgi:hypothetical protein
MIFQQSAAGTDMAWISIQRIQGRGRFSVNATENPSATIQIVTKDGILDAL